MPDGETGVRSNWTRWQSAVFQDHVLLETGPGARDAYRPRARFRPNFRPVWRKIDTKWGSEAELSVYPDVSGLSCSPSNSNARCWTGVGLAVQLPVVLVGGVGLRVDPASLLQTQPVYAHVGEGPGDAPRLVRPWMAIAVGSPLRYPRSR